MIEALTALLVGITGFYAWVTFQMFKAMSRDTEEAMRPYVYFDFVHDPPTTQGHLRNVGRTAAYNINVSLSPEIKVSGKLGDRTASLTSKTTTFLAPGRDVQEYLGTWDELTHGRTEYIFKGTVSYENIDGKRYTEGFVINLSSREGMLHLAKANTADELKKMNDKIDKLTRAVERRT